LRYLHLHSLMKDKYSNHHCFPISLWWVHHESNIARVVNGLHKEIHQTLDLKYSIVRKARMKLNDVLVRTPAKIKDRQNIQRKYFENLDLLPKKWVILHERKFTDQVKYRESQLNWMNAVSWRDKYKVNQELKRYLWRSEPNSALLDSAKEKLETIFELEIQRCLSQLKFIQDVYEIKEEKRNI